MQIQIIPLDLARIPPAADLFIENFRRLRRAAPGLPANFEQPGALLPRLQAMAAAGSALAAVHEGQLVGYLSWRIVDGFRNTARRAAYCPEWGHSAAPEQAVAVYQALYAAASWLWSQAGCQAHAVTFLADDLAQQKFWFWNGFGLAVVDALRGLDACGARLAPGLRVSKATSQYAATLAVLETEHRRHYTQAPVFMAARPVDDAGQITAFIAQPGNSIWLAEWDGQPAGFLRFAAGELDMAEIVQAPDTVGVTAAFTRPEFRGRGVALALLDAALQDYEARGFVRCAVDFESFNPQAANLWLRYFTPVCFSVVRVPEAPE